MRTGQKNVRRIGERVSNRLKILLPCVKRLFCVKAPACQSRQFKGQALKLPFQPTVVRGFSK